MLRLRRQYGHRACAPIRYANQSASISRIMLSYVLLQECSRLLLHAAADSTFGQSHSREKSASRVTHYYGGSLSGGGPSGSGVDTVGTKDANVSAALADSLLNAMFDSVSTAAFANRLAATALTTQEHLGSV